MIEIDNIYNMDCLEGMKMIADNSVDCIICDLPYGVTGNQWDSCIPLDALWAEYKRIIKDKGAIVLFGSEPFSSTLRLSNLKWYKYDWIWEKERGTGFQIVKVRPLIKCENISVFCKTTPKYNPQMVPRDKPYFYKHNANSNGKSKTSPLTHAKQWDAVYDARHPVNILRYGRDPKGFHPTQKPLDLLRYLVLTYTDENDLVLDNCMGSGTTAVACIKEHRHYIGFELDKEYVEKANQRIDKERQQLSLF